MKRTTVFALTWFVLWMSVAGAIEWKGRAGISVRAPLYSPVLEGKDYRLGSNKFEPFMMGLGGNLELKYGVSNSFALAVSGGYWLTYDDQTAGKDQSVKLYKKDNASTKLSVIPLGLTGQVYFLPSSNIQPFLLAGVGLDLAKFEDVNTNADFSVTDLTGKAGAGIHFWFGESFAFDIGGRFSYILTNLSNDLADVDTSGRPISLDYVDFDKSKTRPFQAVIEPSLGLTYFFTGAKDSDKDGIKDKFDQCPDTPKGALVDEFGCPLDADGDGVYDGLDLCPDTPKGAFVDISGCPLDADRDGVPDGIDLCPDTPAGLQVDVFGCPLDGDKDGVPDFKDQQLDTPQGAMVDELGVAIDADKDGVPDGIDKCPDTPTGTAVDQYGCPLAKPITEKISLNILYAPGSAEPDAEAKKKLDDVIERMSIYPQVKLEVNGYTDALGSERSNLKLSQKRAEAVRDYLIAKGVSPDRLVAKGFGEANPVDTNETPEGRQRNRRVELVPF